MKVAASNYFSGFTESSSSSANDDLHEPRDNKAPIGALRRAYLYATLLNDFVGDAASFSLPAATAVERSLAASPSSPADDPIPSPVAEDSTEDYGLYLLEFLGLESSPSEGQGTDDIAETNQKPMSHKDSYSQQKQFLFDPRFYSSTESDENYFLLKHATEESSVEYGSEIDNVNVQLQNDSFINPNDSSNYQGETAPIHYNPWSTEDWITYINFNNKYMDMPPEVASAVGPPPFYSDARYIALLNPYVADPDSLPVTIVEQRSPVASPSLPAYDPSPVAEDSTDGREEQFASDLRLYGFMETENSSPKHNNNVESGSSNEGEVASIHYNPWSIEDWITYINFNNKYMDMPPEVDSAVGPPPPIYSDAQCIALLNAYVADPASLPVTVEQRSPVGSPSSAPADDPSPVAEDSTDGQDQEQFASDLRFYGFIEITENSSPKHNNVESGSSNEGEVAPTHYHPGGFKDWIVHMNFINNKCTASPEVDLAPPPYGGFSYYSYPSPVDVMQVNPLIFNVPYCPVNDKPINPELCAKISDSN